MFTATKFLYTGDKLIQYGVAPGTIDPKRVAIVRGKVLDKNNDPLPGVIITILSHPEFGVTLSREDGMFDMAVNGGGLLTINYAKANYLTTQRQLNVPWQDYVMAPDVCLVPLDTEVTEINLNAPVPIQVAHGSVVTDNDGTRQATLMVTQGTAAEMVLPDGSTQPLTTLSIRATEYTTGPNGPNTMPGELPPTSGYTYCIEVSADEALTEGATSVTLSQPIYTYVENFIGFPVGSAVPAGYYDRKTGQWVPAANGRVIRIISITSGLADIDTDGDGNADSGLGITTAERQQLAALYPLVPKQLWRIPITHFTPWDFNWPYGPTQGATDPKQPDPVSGLPEDEACEGSGSIVECQNQVLGQRIPVIGTPFTLNYRSDRTPGRLASKTVKIPLSGSSLPPGNQQIVLEVRVAGGVFPFSFAPAPNLSHTFIWDGKDAYGRMVQGLQPVLAKIGYVYQSVYYPVNADFEQSFSRMSPSAQGVMSRESSTITLYQNWTGYIGNQDFQGQGLGGWSLDVHHVYDPSSRTIYFGDGSRRSAASAFMIVDTVAGTGNQGYSGDGGPAVDALLNNPWGGSVGPDGSFYIADRANHVIRKVTPDGIINTVAGNGTPGYGGDGFPATLAMLYGPNDVAMGPDGSLYITDTGNCRIRKVDLSGKITTVGGNGSSDNDPWDSEPQPALLRPLCPSQLVVAPDGAIYFIVNGYQIGKIEPSSGITGLSYLIYETVSSNHSITGIALGNDGSLYFSDTYNDHVRRLSQDGIVTTVAGNGLPCWPPENQCGDGGLATEAELNYPTGLAAGTDGTLYIADADDHRIRQVDTQGIITTIAGTGEDCYYSPYPCGDNGPATAAQFDNVYDLALAPNGDLYAQDWQRIRRIRLSSSAVLIPSEDASQVYVFDPSGRHLKTQNAYTGKDIYTFQYDAAGLLVGIENMNKLKTTIDRDASGTPKSITGTYNQKTWLSLDSNGYLSGITNPAGEPPYQFFYTPDGLMQSMQYPKGEITTYHFDSEGRLDFVDPTGPVYQTLHRSEIANGYQVLQSTAMSRNTFYRMENLATGDRLMTNTFPGNIVVSARTDKDGKKTLTYPHGTIATMTSGPDPRFGMQAPIPKEIIVSTPGGLSQTINTQRTVSLADPKDPLSLLLQTDTVTINGLSYTGQYSSTSKELQITSPVGRWVTLTYDDMGRFVKRQTPGIEPVTITYRSDGQLESVYQGLNLSTRRTISFGYDSLGNLQTITDPLLQPSTFTYDSADRIIKQTFADLREVFYGYDANSDLMSITPPGRPVHRYTNDPLNLVLEYIPPDAGAGNNKTTYNYNADMQISQITRPDGTTVGFGYDSAGRLQSIATPQGTTGFSYYPNTGNLFTITAPDEGTIVYTYDGSLVKKVEWQGTVAGSIDRAYDNNFRLISRKVNGANEIIFGYDNDGLLLSAGSLTFVRDLQNGLIQTSTLGNITDFRNYSSFGEVDAYSASFQPDPICNLQFVREKTGRITQKTETIGGVTSIYGYSYDAAGKLTAVTLNSVPYSSYTYDSNGNRMTLTKGATTVTGTYDAQDRMTQYGTTNYTYTANGELQTKTNSGQTTTYSYDAFGNLLNVNLPDGTQIEYLIDGLNRRIGKKVNGSVVQRFLFYSATSPVAELDDSGNVSSLFVYGVRGNVPEYMVKGGTTFRIVTDHLGSVRLVVNSSTGAIAQRIDYDEFGNILTDTSPGFQPFGFAGGLYDQHTKLTRFGARDYDAETGRWTNKEPYLFLFGTNAYEYSENDPVNFVDLNGLAPNLNFFPESDWRQRVAQQVPAEEGVFIIVGHGNPNAVTVNGKRLDAEDLWNLIERSVEKYEAREGKRAIIRLLICNTGNEDATDNPLAEQLAFYSSRTVEAATRKVHWITDKKTKTMYVGYEIAKKLKWLNNSHMRYKLKDQGTLKPFTSDEIYKKDAPE
jgi:RHS repeat-associated protein